MDSRGHFKLHLPGLLKVLAEHLYSTQKVGVRELLQNAHDSCVRRTVEFPDTDYRPRIDLTADESARTLRISDNGCGLTEQEINEYLTVIGRGYTRELRSRLAIEDPDVSQELIGQFGIGFLSAFLLATEVVVQTRSVAGGRPLRWFSSGDEHFDLTMGDRLEPGTTVELRLKPSALFLLHEPNLLDVVQAYADFLPTPIHVQGSPAAANLGSPPWDAPDPEVGCREYVARRHETAEPLWLLQLTDGSVDLGHDTLTVPLKGFLYIPPESVASIKEYGDLTIYIRRMAICDDEKDLLPPWARFVRGVIDCPALQPTASREAVHQDDAFETVRRTLADQLSRALHRLAKSDPVVWRRIAHGHSDVIIGWAVKEPEFFDFVADAVPLRTTRGRLTLPEYLKTSGGVVYYVTRQLGTLQDQVLAEARDVPVVDASWFAVPAFLSRYAKKHPLVTLVRLDDDPESLLRPAPLGKLSDLVQLCEEMGFRVRVAAFKPSAFPAVMTYPSEAETIRDATRALDEGLFPDGFSDLVQGYVEQRRVTSADQGTLHLNAECPLMQRLASESIDAARRQAAIGIVVHFALLFCGRMLNADQATDEIRALHDSLDRLLSP